MKGIHEKESHDKKQYEKEENSRVSYPHGHTRGAASTESAAGEGQKAINCLNGRAVCRKVFAFLANARLVTRVVSDQSFGRSERIRKRRDYLLLYRSGKRVHTDHFIIVMHHNEVGVKRLGITTGRQVGNAVKRNRIKRLVREFFRRNKHRFLDACDTVIIAKKGIPTLSYHDVCRELGNFLRTKIDA